MANSTIMNFVAHPPPMRVFGRLTLFITLALLFFGEASAATQEPVSVTDVSPNVLVFATSSGNVVASVGPDGVLLIGTPSVGSTEEIDKILRSRTSSALRYVVIY